MVASDDNWALFAVDVVERPAADVPSGFCLMWAGTNNAVVNELMCQALKRDAHPFELKDFNLVAEGEKGLLFGIPVKMYEDEELRNQLYGMLAETARTAAEQQGYEFHVAEPGSFPSGFMFMAARLNVDVQRRPWTSEDGEGEQEGQESEEEQ